MKGYTTMGVFFCVAFLDKFKIFLERGIPYMVHINGKEEAASGMALKDYLEQNHYPPDRIAVECNEEILAKSQYGSYVLQDGDVVEIVSFVGGG